VASPEVGRRAAPEGHTGPYDSKLFQPALMQGTNARQLLENLRSRSATLDTSMAIDSNKGVITISQTNRRLCRLGTSRFGLLVWVQMQAQS